MTIKSSVLTLFLIFGGFCSNGQNAFENQILWDNWGVPHIYAKDNQSLFYGLGWAQMQSHTNLILKLYGKSRGRSAEYWGESNLQSDILLHKLGFPDLAKKWYGEQDSEMKLQLEAFVDGMNDYATKYLERVNEENLVVLPIQYEDVHALFLYDIYYKFSVEDNLFSSQRLKGSNAYAIAPSRSSSGNAMLVTNPHLPWSEEYTFYEAHLNVGDLNLYGATLVGLPVLVNGFNENLGWAHTVNPIDITDLFALELKEDGYEFDGNILSFEKEYKMLKIKKGKKKYKEKSIEILKSVHGSVIQKSSNKAIAIKIAGLDQAFIAKQWWDMGTAQNLENFESALKTLQIPVFNVVYADKEGNILYLYNGRLPKRTEGDWNFWNGIIPGNDSKYLWSSTHEYHELPKVLNPENGWLQNSNDPPWFCAFPAQLNPTDYPAYVAPINMGLRAQRSVQTLMSDDEIEMDELIEYKSSTEIELANRFLDDLLMAIDQTDTPQLIEAKEVLSKWDRKAEINSSGTLLFTQWAGKMNLWDNSTYKQKWSLSEPLTTPNGFSNPRQAVALLGQAADEVKKNYGSLNIEWGSVVRLKRGENDFPANGAPDMLGALRVIWPGGMDKDKIIVGGGESWISITEFGEKLTAKVILSYGNSSEVDSPNYGDQLKLFSEKKYRDALFYREDVLKHAVKKENFK